MKYIIVTGGVVSGLGKGITISSIGRILKSSGLKVTAIKIDPYLNLDAGTMSPFEHGETFVLDDGGETDLDLGNYERFLDVTLTNRHNITSGKIYKEVIKRERRGDYLGKTVQIVPHVTDMIQNWIKEVSKISVDGSGATPDLCLVEVGGTVGDIESSVFLEALRQFQFVVGRENILFVHVSLVPVIGAVGEQKSKPTQHSVKELRALGLSPDLIVCRSSEDVPLSTKQKISVFCHVPVTNILSVYDVSNIYHVPLILEQQGLQTIVRNHLQLEERMSPQPELTRWKEIARIVDTFSQRCPIVIVGKYVGLQDSYLSLTKALRHSSILLAIDIEVLWVEAEHLEESFRLTNLTQYEDAWQIVKLAKGILVPGGFGHRGCLGKIAAAQYAREKRVPYLGICLGMQIMVIEYCRHVLQWETATSTEFEETTTQPVVIFMPEINPMEMGGTMRLGARATMIEEEVVEGEGRGVAPSLASIIYGFQSSSTTTTTTTTTPPTNKGTKKRKGSAFATNEEEEEEAREGLPPKQKPWKVSERHRHRYEINPEKVAAIEERGLFFTGRDETGVRMEIVELPRNQHPFYVGTQFHPEFKSRPGRPSPPFFAFCAAATGQWERLAEAGQLWQRREEEVAEAERVERVGGPVLPLTSPFSSSSGGGPKRRRGSSISEGVPPLTPSRGSATKTELEFRMPETSVLAESPAVSLLSPVKKNQLFN